VERVVGVKGVDSELLGEDGVEPVHPPPVWFLLYGQYCLVRLEGDEVAVDLLCEHLVVAQGGECGVTHRRLRVLRVAHHHVALSP